MSLNKKYNGSEFKNETKFVLFFSFVFVFFLAFSLLSNAKTSTLLTNSLKKENTIQKSMSLTNNDINAEFSLEDFDFDNPSLVPDHTFTVLQIVSFDNRSQILKDHQIRIQFHLPLFLRYHAIKIL